MQIVYSIWFDLQIIPQNLVDATADPVSNP